MTDTCTRVGSSLFPSEAWEYVIDPRGWVTTRPADHPGSDGWISDGDDVRYLIVEEVDEENRLVYRWATFAEEPSRVEIELDADAGRTRVTISESPIEVRARRVSSSMSEDISVIFARSQIHATTTLRTTPRGPLGG